MCLLGNLLRQNIASAEKDSRDKYFQSKSENQDIILG